MMDKRVEKAGIVCLLVLCMGIYCGYASGQSDGNAGAKQETSEAFFSGEELAEGWQETEEAVIDSTWANSHSSRICFMDGYYYYASQSDHYYLYRVREDGSGSQCLAKIHPGSICAQDGYVYFINQSDGHGIYRMKADGAGMEKLCEDGHNLQISDDYVFFCSSAFAETLETTGILVGGVENGELYRMKKDGSEKELVAEDVWDYVLSDGHSQETKDMDIIYYSRTEEKGITVYQMDFNGQKEEEVCHFDIQGKLVVSGGNLYCIGIFYEDRNMIPQFSLADGEMYSFTVPDYTDCCIYNGYFYGLYEREEGFWELTIFRKNLNCLESGNTHWMYHNPFDENTIYHTHDNRRREATSDIYATENGIVFRQFVSQQEGCRWFKLTEDREGQESEYNISLYDERTFFEDPFVEAQELEDREKIPIALPARKIDHGDRLSVTLMLHEMSTEGYEAFLSDYLEYEEYFSEDEEGEPCNLFRIYLPQFNSKIAGYQQINLYFQNMYQECFKEKDYFMGILDKEEPLKTGMYSQITSCSYVYVGKEYITVGVSAEGYSKRGQSWKDLRPVTFDRDSGEVVSLEEILGMTTQEAAARLTGAIYKHREGLLGGTMFLREGNLLTSELDMESFLLFSDGIGIYYPVYSIDRGAAGDFLYIIPWEDALRNW